LTARPARRLALAAASLAAACVFDPTIPSGRVICGGDPDCPRGYSCQSVDGTSVPVSICCKQKDCAVNLTPEEVGRLETVVLGRVPPGEQGGQGGGRADAPARGDGESGGTCGNGKRELGETCDPPSSCPSSCPQMGCETFELAGSPSTCNARCEPRGRQTACKSGDKCCPAGCSGDKDDDCNCVCGNGTVEKECGETCDPASSCPTTCPARGCMLRRMVEAGTCRATCVDDRPQTTCVNGDECCPPGCNANNDTDCKPTCGNEVVEADETCDPSSQCTVLCPNLGCTLQKVAGAASSCNTRCIDAGKQTTCAAGDSCCPPGCTTANDADCACTCGNRVVEAACGETCDPLSSCPASCPPVGCQLRRLVNAGTCQAQCVDDRLQSECHNADGCCPAGCNANNDDDCKARCGNAAREAGETCDPPSSCPTTCPWMGCTKRKLEGAASACTARCSDDGTQTTCAHGDGCCPPGCNSTNDNDCAARCGNGVMEAGEKCDGNCPTSCPAQGCQRRTLQGDPAQCTAECVNTTLITGCASGDGCCPGGCTSVNDGECMCQCGNGVVEPACSEKCDGNCPTSCPPMGCQLRMLSGSPGSCTAECVNAGTRTTCASNDGCCPSGCNANNDNDCAPVCGNSVVESGETCDPASACQAQFDMCIDDSDTDRTRVGSVSACTFTCTSVPRTCGAMSDGFCPSTCTPCGATCGANQDIDCKLANGAVCTHNNQCATACLDARCCAVTSCAACQWCRGVNGACANIARYGEDTVPAGTCTGVNSCDGTSGPTACKKDNGQPCTAGTQCASGQCVDGVCCVSACATVCNSCNLAGTVGMCQPIPSGPDSTGSAMCIGSLTCVNGGCLTADGFACTMGTDCASGACSTFYRDNDGDGEGAGAPVRLCGGTPPSGYAAVAGDCCDSDNRVKTTQTSYFTFPSNCGTYDYNCANGEEKQWTRLNMCTAADCWASWHQTAVPNCGVSGTWKDCGGQGCGQFTEFPRTQACR
jgi:hypothetical protein